MEPMIYCDAIDLDTDQNLTELEEIIVDTDKEFNLKQIC